MQAKNLAEIIKSYNSHKDDIFDHCVDLFISQVQNSIEEIYNNGNWTLMVDVTQLGISLKNMSRDFRGFEFDILSGYLMRFGSTVHDEFGFPTFQEFIDSKGYEGFELYCFQSEDILQIKPFYEALKRKGFECYVDEDDRLVVTLDI